MSTPDDEQRLSFERDGARINVRGEMDSHSMGAPLVYQNFQTLIGEAASEPDAAIGLDLGEVTFIDSTGLRTMLETNDQVSRDGKVLELHRVSYSTRRLLEISGVIGVFNIVDEPWQQAGNE